MYFTIPHLIFDISSKSEGFETIGFSKVFAESNQSIDGFIKSTRRFTSKCLNESLVS